MTTYRDTFAGISSPALPVLETNVDTLNTQKGTVAAVGGLIKGYQDTQEANKLANFNNALLDMTNKGDTEGLKQLATYSDQFRDATTKQKAFGEARGAFDTTAAALLLNEAEQKKQVGDLVGYQQVMAKAQATGLTPKTLGTVQSKLGADLPVITGNALFKNALASYNAGFDEINAGNVKAYNDTFTTNPEYSKYFVNANGRLIPNLIDPNSPTAATDQAKQTELEKQFYSVASQKGAKASIGDVDKTLTEFRTRLRAANVPEDQIARLSQGFASEAMQKSQLGPQLKAKEAELHAVIDSKSSNELARLDSKYKLTSKFTEADIADASKAHSFKQDDLYDHVNKNFDNTTWYSTYDGRDEIKKKLQGVLNTELSVGTGKRVPQPYEVKQALDILSTNPLFRDAKVADMDLIKSTLAGVMKDQVVGRADALKVPLADIDKYYKDKQQVQSGNTAEKLRVTGRLLSGAGISDTSSILTADVPKTTPTTTIPAQQPNIRPNIRPNFAAEAIESLKNIPKNNVGNLKDAKTGEIRTFNTPEEGVAAVKSQLTRYMEKGSPITGEKVTNIKGIIDNWRPASDTKGNPRFISQENYYKTVSKILGVGITDPIKPTETTLNRLVEAIAKVEHGKNIKLAA